MGFNQARKDASGGHHQEDLREIVMQGQTFFEFDDVKVTNVRFMTGVQTFAMNNVTSVKTKIDKPSRFGGILIPIAKMS